MSGMHVTSETHHKGWDAKLQRVWSKRDKTGYITIIETVFSISENRYEVWRDGKPYAFDRTYDSLDEAISMAEASMLEYESMYIDNDKVIPGSKPLTQKEMRDAGIIKEARVILEEDDTRRLKSYCDFDEEIQVKFRKIDSDLAKFEKSREREELATKGVQVERREMD